MSLKYDLLKTYTNIRTCLNRYVIQYVIYLKPLNELYLYIYYFNLKLGDDPND